MNQAKVSRKNGEKLRRKLLEEFFHLGLNIGIKKDFIVRENQYIFQFKTKGKTISSNIDDCLNELRWRLELQTLELQKKYPKMLLIASEKKVATYNIIDVLKSPEFAKAKLQMEVPFAAGYSAAGDLVIEDMEEFPHLMIGGETKMGKTICLKCILLCMLTCSPPDKIQLIIYDGASALTEFYGFPHLKLPVIQDPVDGYNAVMNVEHIMKQRVEEREKRKNFDNHFYPMIFLTLDEFQSLIKRLSKIQVERMTNAIAHIATSGRHVGIHLIITAHFPKKDNIGDCDLSNVPARIAFKCSSVQQSTVLILDSKATKLERKGEMWFRISEDKQIRVQGAYISDSDLVQVLNHARLYWNRNADVITIYDSSSIITEGTDLAPQDVSEFYPASTTPNTIDHFTVQQQLSEDDLFFVKIMSWSLKFETLSNKNIMDEYKIGYDKAKRYINRLYEIGIVSELHEKRARQIIPIVPSDLTPEARKLFDLAGFTSEQIADAFNAEKKINVSDKALGIDSKTEGLNEKEE